MNEKIYRKLENKVDKLEAKYQKNINRGTEKAYYLMWRSIIKKINYKKMFQSKDGLITKVYFIVRPKGKTMILNELVVNNMQKNLFDIQIDIDKLKELFAQDNFLIETKQEISENGLKEIRFSFDCNIENITNILRDNEQEYSKKIKQKVRKGK